MQPYLCVSDIARRLGANPKDISDLFYRRELRDDLCPIIAGRRLIPESYIPQIDAALKRAGRKRCAARQEREAPLDRSPETSGFDAFGVTIETVAKEDFPEFLQECVERNLRIVRTDEVDDDTFAVQVVPEEAD